MLLFSVSELENYAKNRTIEENGVFVYNCEVTQDLIQETATESESDPLVQMCVHIEPHQYTERMISYQRLDGEFLRSSRQHAPADVIRSYTHENKVNGTLVKYKVLDSEDWLNFMNRTEKDLEKVVIIPSGSIVYCSLGNPQITCKHTFLNGSSPLRYIVEGVYTCVSYLTFA